MEVCQSFLETDPELARNLFENGAVLIVAGVPDGTEFGLDCTKNVVASKFRGVKMVWFNPCMHNVVCI